MVPFKKAVLAAMIPLMLAGCSTTKEVKGNITKEAAEASAQRARIDESKRVGWVVRDKGVNLTGGEIEIANESPDPEWMHRKYVYITADQKLPEILSVLSREIGVHAQITEEAMAELAKGAGNTPFHVDWSGTVKGFLNHLALRTALHWKAESGRILFFREETRNFHVYLPGGKSTLNSSIALSGAGGGGDSGGSGSGGGGGSSGGTVSVSSATTIDAYDSLLKSVQNMVGGGGSDSGGSKVSITPSLGILSVTAPPPVLERVAEFVRGVNERFARNVMINIKVYNVMLKRDQNAGMQLNDMFRTLSGDYAFLLSGASLLQPKGGSPGTMILERSTTTGSRTSQLLVQALNQLGDVSLLTSGQVIAANGQPSPLQVGSEVTYLASSATTQTADVGTTTTLTPGKQSVGFTANFLPTLLGDNRILLQYQLNLSSLLALDQVSSGGSSIQTPNVSTQSLQQQAFLKDGQSIVLFGFESSRSAYDKSYGLTGASTNASGNRQMMVIVMEVFSGQS